MQYHEMKVENLGRMNATPMGYAGENLYRGLKIDCSGWLQEHPNANISMVWIRPDGSTYPLVTRVEESYLIWEPSDQDTYYDGVGEIQVILTDGSVVGKSAIAQVNVERSISSGSEPPPAQPDWVITIIQAKEEAVAASVTARDAANRAEQAESDVEHGLAAKADKTYVDDQLARKLDTANGYATGLLSVENENVGGFLVVQNAGGNGGLLKGYSSGAELRVIDGTDARPLTDASGSLIASIKKSEIVLRVPIFFSSSLSSSYALSLSGKLITNLGDPTAPYDAANKKYVDDIASGINTNLNKKITNASNYQGVIEIKSASELGTAAIRISSGDLGVPAIIAFTAGVINAGGAEVVRIATPTQDASAATKKYVDDAIAALRTEILGG